MAGSRSLFPPINRARKKQQLATVLEGTHASGDTERAPAYDSQKISWAAVPSISSVGMERLDALVFLSSTRCR